MSSVIPYPCIAMQFFDPVDLPTYSEKSRANFDMGVFAGHISMQIEYLCPVCKDSFPWINNECVFGYSLKLVPTFCNIRVNWYLCDSDSSHSNPCVTAWGEREINGTQELYWFQSETERNIPWWIWPMLKLHPQDIICRDSPNLLTLPIFPLPICSSSCL